MFKSLVTAMGRAEFVDDPRFRDNSARMENVEELERHIGDWTQTLNAAELLHVLQAIGVPSAKVASISELVDNPQLAHRGQIIHMAHPKAGTVPMQGFSVHFGDSTMRLRRPPPTLGQHSDAVLQEWLAMTVERIEQLREQGIV
jgi:crotonobetainyl-CoA:carnitine CoA-transferase CaiB-like acyl-CoA transferase